MGEKVVNGENGGGKRRLERKPSPSAVLMLE